MRETIDGREIEYEVGSGNIFADLGAPDPEESQVKADLARSIQNIIKSKGFTQAEAAAIVGLTQPKLNNILRGRFRGYSVERLLNIVNLLGHDVEVKISKKSRTGAPGKIVVKAA